MSSGDTTNTTKKPAAPKRPRGEHNFPLAGLITLASILGLATFAAQIPTWNDPKQMEYVCSTSIATSVTGITPGSPVLVGGIECGQVTTVSTVLDSANGTPSEIEITFQLNSDIPVRMDAVIRKYVGISSSNGSLNFDNLGTPAHAFEAGQRRDLPLSMAASGSIAFIGQRASSNATKAQYLADLFQKHVNDLTTRSKDQVTTMQGDLEKLRLHIPADVQKWKTIVNRITSGTPGWTSRWRMMVTAFENIQMALDPVGTFMTWTRNEATISLGNSMNNARLARSEMQSMMDQGTELQERFAALGNIGRDSIGLGKKTLHDLQTLVPEVQTSLQQASARGALAGGQLSRLSSSILITGLDALLFSPDDASWNRRKLLETVEDAILAATSLKQASASLDAFSASHAEVLQRSPRLAKLLSEGVDSQMQELNKRLRILYEYVLRKAP